MVRVSDEARELWWTMRGKVKQLQTEEQSGRAQKMAAVREMLREMSVHFHGVAIQVQVSVPQFTYVELYCFAADLPVLCPGSG